MSLTTWLAVGWVLLAALALPVGYGYGRDKKAAVALFYDLKRS